MTSVRKKEALNLIDKHVGGRLRMRRMMLDMSQEKLADAFGITFQQVQKYEKGTNRISASRLQHAANLLQVPVQFFFEGAPVGSGTQPDGSARSPAYVSEFLELRWAEAHQSVHTDRERCAATDRRSRAGDRGSRRRMRVPLNAAQIQDRCCSRRSIAMCPAGSTT